MILVNPWNNRIYLQLLKYWIPYIPKIFLWIAWFRYTSLGPPLLRIIFYFFTLNPWTDVGPHCRLTSPTAWRVIVDADDKNPSHHLNNNDVGGCIFLRVSNKMTRTGVPAHGKNEREEYNSSYVQVKIYNIIIYAKTLLFWSPSEYECVWKLSFFTIRPADIIFYTHRQNIFLSDSSRKPVYIRANWRHFPNTLMYKKNYTSRVIY